MATGILVSDIMRKAVITAKENDSILKIAQVMKKADIGGLVITKEEKVMGIITEGDIIKEVVAEGLDPRKVQVKDVMKHPVRTITPDTDVEEAIRIMRDLNIERLPVVSNGKLTGLVTERDITLIEPALLELVREKEKQPVIKPETSLSGYCESCGNYSEGLRLVNGRYLCEECREEEGA